MTNAILFNKIWFDDDMIELRIKVSDGQSEFTNDVYVGHHNFSTVVSELDEFKTLIYGGIYDLAFGRFGPEYAHGAFHARLHFQERGILNITTSSESEFRDFGKKNVASAATFYLRTEPALLDNFIAELKEMRDGARDEAALAAI
jgi:hypothetical protein